MGWQEVRKKFKKVGEYWFEKPTSVISFATLNGVNHMELNTASENGIRSIKLMRVPIAKVGTNRNGLEYTEEVLKVMEPTWDGVPVQGDFLMKSNDHTLTEDKTNIMSYGTVGWTSNPTLSNGVQYVDILVTEPTTIDKLLRKNQDGKRELNGVSMGAFTYDICSVCGKTRGDCEHEVFKVYNDIECHWIAVDGFGHHVAFTNDPAEDTWLDNVQEQITED